MYSLNAMGMDMRHAANFIIDRPYGSGDCLLIIFKTNAILTLDGCEQTVPPDSAVIFDKDSPQYYRACGSYTNHYLHFSADEEDISDSLRFDTLLMPEGIREAEEIMRMLGREQLSDSPNKGEYISMLIRMLLMKLSEPPAEKTVPQSTYGAMLDELRAEIYTSPGRFGSVASLAERINLSPSHFQHIYKSRYGVSCYEDLLKARTGTAQYYLTSTDLTIRAIADLCGYKNEICFMHRFKERTGMTPTAYRKRLSGI